MISNACKLQLHSECVDITCECGCHDNLPDTGENGETYDIEMEQNH